MSGLGFPRVHFRLTDSTSLRAHELTLRGAPHGTLVTAAEQSAGRGRQGRSWSAPPGRALLCSLVVRDPPPLLSLVAGVAVAETVDAVGSDGASHREGARIKWPNDVLVAGRKVAGILVEGRPQERWAVLGIGLNVAVRLRDFPEELRDTAGTLGLDPAAIEPSLELLLARLTVWLGASADDVLEAVRVRDALLGQPVRWAGGAGTGAGLDNHGRLLVEPTDGHGQVALDAGEIHLARDG